MSEGRLFLVFLTPKSQGQVVLMSARILNLEKEKKEAAWVSVYIYRQKNLCTLKEKSLLGWHLRSDLTSPSMKHGFLVLFLRGWGELCYLRRTKKNT